MALISKIHIEPYEKQQYRIKSSKSVFKEQHFYSHILRAIEANKLTNVFKNDSIIEGLNIINISLINNNNTITFSLSPGRIIQDNTLINILETVTISIDIFNEYNILNTNIEQNYFEIDGDVTDKFSKNKQFGLYEASYLDLNHSNWVVKDIEFQNNKTKIYPVNPIMYDDTSGIIINDNFSNLSSVYGTILIMSKYRFHESVDVQDVEFVPVYVVTNNYFTTISESIPSISLEEYRIIYGIIYIQKINHKISNDYYFALNGTAININGKSLFVRNTVDKIENLDLGEILIC